MQWAFSLALDVNLQAVRISSDCLEVIKNLERTNLCSCSMILKEIAERRKLIPEAQFCHEGRENNVEAHGLAKAAVSLYVGRQVWFVNPPNIVHVPLNIVE